MKTVKQILPKEAYFSKEWFEDEQKNIFSKHWQFVSMAKNLEEDRSFIVDTVAHTPIAIINDKGTLNAFINICKHRGIQLLNGNETLDSSIVCPYHHWSYDLQGSLKGVPKSKEFPRLDKSCMGLTKIQCEVWQGMVFVNLDQEAAPLHTTLDPIKNEILPYDDMSQLKQNDGYEYIINANWKIFVENYMDVYHLFYIHKKSLKEYSHQEARFRYEGENWLFYQPLSEAGKSSSKWWDFMGTINSFNGQKGAYVSMLFPNFGITATENLCMFVHVKPLNEEKTKISVHVKSAYGAKNTKMDLVYNSQEKSDQQATLLNKPDVMNEDIYACEMIQKSIKSDFFQVNTLAQNLEKPLFDFQTIVKNKIK